MAVHPPRVIWYSLVDPYIVRIRPAIPPSGGDYFRKAFFLLVYNYPSGPVKLSFLKVYIFFGFVCIVYVLHFFPSIMYLILCWSVIALTSLSVAVQCLESGASGAGMFSLAWDAISDIFWRPALLAFLSASCPIVDGSLDTEQNSPPYNTLLSLPLPQLGQTFFGLSLIDCMTLRISWSQCWHI